MLCIAFLRLIFVYLSRDSEDQRHAVSQCPDAAAVDAQRMFEAALAAKVRLTPYHHVLMPSKPLMVLVPYSPQYVKQVKRDYRLAEWHPFMLGMKAFLGRINGRTMPANELWHTLKESSARVDAAFRAKNDNRTAEVGEAYSGKSPSRRISTVSSISSFSKPLMMSQNSARLPRGKWT